MRFGLFASDPRDQCVDVTEGGHVRGNNPQGCIHVGVGAVQLLGEGQASIVDARRGHDDGRASGEQLAHDRGSDRVGSRAGNNGDISSETAFGCLKGGLGNLREVGLQLRIRRVSGIPGRQCAQGLAASAQTFCGNLGGLKRSSEDACKIFARGCPAVIQENRAALVESGANRGFPICSQLGLDSGDQGGRILDLGGEGSLG